MNCAKIVSGKTGQKLSFIFSKIMDFFKSRGEKTQRNIDCDLLAFYEKEGVKNTTTLTAAKMSVGN